ncbi:hypothetical protein HAHI6034_13075 [Hathewaya histolytica]|uniref:Uncharacterized protein n=1 Tax=Hathewaya histolytica TaxID=1498 RepID=A0A4U9RSG9_HATHI|nr:hypothetical protein [Hathewaya histolytica]VTQ95272.1 Uncharacterised protein [Hathewaya histolytica]
MSKYSLDISGKIDLSDYSMIDDYINVVGNNDILKISIDNYEKDEVGIICSILENKDFSIESKGSSNNGKYYIRASKEM